MIKKIEWEVDKQFGVPKKKAFKQKQKKKKNAKVKKTKKKRIPKYNKDNGIMCEVCGEYFRQVGSHVKVHGFANAREYREHFGFDVKRGQLPKEYRKIKADHCRKNKTIDNLKSGKKCWFKKGQKNLGNYKRSKQTMNRLQGNSSNNWHKKRDNEKDNH